MISILLEIKSKRFRVSADRDGTRVCWSDIFSMPDESTVLMYILANHLSKTYATLMSLTGAKSDNSKQQHSHFYSAFSDFITVSPAFPPDTHHSRGQKHLLQLSPSCSCWRLSGSITLRPSLLSFVLAHIKGEGISLFFAGVSALNDPFSVHLS